MKRLPSILIACCLHLCLQASAQLPPYSPPPPPLDEGQTWEDWTNGVTYQCSLITSASTNVYFKNTADLTNAPAPPTEEQLAMAIRRPAGRLVRAVEPANPDPRYVVKAMTDLNGKAVMVEIRIEGDQGFYQAGLEVAP